MGGGQPGPRVHHHPLLWAATIGPGLVGRGRGGGRGVGSSGEGLPPSHRGLRSASVYPQSSPDATRPADGKATLGRRE